jgi:ABC-type multidrug transport system permease subunit
MRIAQKINKFSYIVTLFLYLTVIFGLYAQIALGAVQILIALYISFNIESLTKKMKYQIINYWIYVALYSAFATAFFNDWIDINDNNLLLIITIIIIPMSIATYFTITLNKITKQNEKQTNHSSRNRFFGSSIGKPIQK